MTEKRSNKNSKFLLRKNKLLFMIKMKRDLVRATTSKRATRNMTKEVFIRLQNGKIGSTMKLQIDINMMEVIEEKITTTKTVKAVAIVEVRNLNTTKIMKALINKGTITKGLTILTTITETVEGTNIIRIIRIR